jgi:transposase-like protein
MPAKKRSTSTAPETLLQAVRYFADARRSFEFVAALRWPSGPECPRCEAKAVSFLESRQVWKCKACKKQFSVKVGTIFEDSPIGLDKWLPAMWMIANCKNGVSSYELARALDVTQKTAWFMLHRIRLAMQSKSFRKFDGNIEADETYIGGKARNMHKNKRKAKGTGPMGKVAVMGLLERHGEDVSQIRTQILATTKQHEVQGEVKKNVEIGANLYTDAYGSYTGLDARYVHQVIDHAECYAKGQVHTNGLENFWSLLKRSIKGTYVSVEPFHLFRYLDEQTFRFNARKDGDGARFIEVLRSISGRRLTYQGLIGEEASAPA